MNEQSEKELKMLIDKRWDPTRGVGKWLGSIRYFLTGAFLVALVFGSYFSSLHPLMGFAYFVPAMGLIVCWMVPSAIRKRTQEKAQNHDWFLCPWCRYALTDLEDQGVCPECGAGYRREVCVVLYKGAYQSYKPSPQMLKKRETAAWREAIELRDLIDETDAAKF